MWQGWEKARGGGQGPVSQVGLELGLGPGAGEGLGSFKAKGGCVV